MNFAAFDFWIYLCTALGVCWLLVMLVKRLAPSWAAFTTKSCFIATSFFLLYSNSPLTLYSFLWVVLLGWAAILCMKTGRSSWLRTLCFLVLVLAQAAPLVYFKYWGFLCREILHVDWAIPHVLIPMGLSFHTFQTIAICLDSRRDSQPAPSFMDYLNFSSFFPQIVAGPIERKSDLLPQIQRMQLKIQSKEIPRAIGWIVLGLFYKIVIADNLSAMAGSAQLSADNAWHVWQECFVFGVRIYFDFAGYSFIAVGLGYLFGVSLTLNFLSPYLSKDIREFWRRWHTTLSRWLKDYVYFPLGGSRTKRWALNIIIVFLASGLWHGAGWNFILWGLLHGAAVAFSSWGKPWALPGWVKNGSTLVFVTFTWLFFLESDTTLLLHKLRSLFTPSAYLFNPLTSLDAAFPTSADVANLGFICVLAGICLFVEWISLRRQEPYALLRGFGVSTVMVALIVFLAPMKEATFIYFNF